MTRFQAFAILFFGTWAGFALASDRPEVALWLFAAGFGTALAR